MEKVLCVGILIAVLGGLCMIGGAIAFGQNPYAIIVPMSVITLGNGFLFPVSSAGAMTAVRLEVSGTASGLIGAMQFTLAAFCTNWIGELCQGRAFSMALFVGAIILVGLCSYLWLVVCKPKARVTAT
jgi:DHA1 family bicyclomycin/chloramphenicol resistance-like MFS transporter